MHLSTSSFVRTLAIGVAAAAVAVTVGCSGPSEPAASTPAPATTASSEAPAPASPTATTASATPDSSSPTTAAELNDALVAAGRLAAKEVTDGTVVSIESERDGWEVHVVLADGGEREVRTDLSGSRVIAGPTDERPDADDKVENRRFSKVEIDFVKAVEAITGEVNDGRITELSLDTEGRRVVWEADVSVGSQERTVKLDANTGDVLSNRADD